ncbi:urease accessory protein UreE [Neptunomonas phycophila]|jgi:urease accessory protein|uniref:Urease accessory protein UreE n=1 Tax=Neptunomonas phycophila TaxID=1572645 RepID=A0AAW7XNT0_9GAMM|nr:urease accessory protein UreE [Neptunomonas phycophila]MBT3144506.1 urease accessory protein UreE [Neptunomonas phycophila]MDO6454983.1 urease accessory protein UreE [Neptunomonas phycophila]QLE96585.1 urease accessory protein UreE [Neptunomonas phycophila]
MKQFTKQVDVSLASQATLSLPINKRIKGRLRVELDTGEEAGLFLQRGITLRDGDQIATEDGYVVRIIAANESVSTVQCHDPLLLTRIAYHLGNRHVPLQVGDGFVRYQHDHVLDDMVKGLGGQVVSEQAPFEPEAGAYGGSSSHGHHEHGHHHAHAHDHEH